MGNQQDSTNDPLAEKLAKAQAEAKQEEEKFTEENSEIDRLQQELTSMTEMAKRAMAEMQNVKLQMGREKNQFIKYANLELIKSLLPILDNFERALAHTPENATEWAKGIEMSLNQFRQTLFNAGLSPIEINPGDKFNPDLHEALAQSEGEQDSILEVFEKGYTLGDRVIRHAKVKVGNGQN